MRKQEKVRVWNLGRDGLGAIPLLAQAGDRVDPRGRGVPFRELRRALLNRGLPLGCIGSSR
jgi:hypothetical protein